MVCSNSVISAECKLRNNLFIYRFNTEDRLQYAYASTCKSALATT